MGHLSCKNKLLCWKAIHKYQNVLQRNIYCQFHILFLIGGKRDQTYMPFLRPQ